MLTLVVHYQTGEPSQIQVIRLEELIGVVEQVMLKLWHTRGTCTYLQELRVHRTVRQFIAQK